MDFDLSDDQTALRHAARELLTRESSSERVERACASGIFDEDLWDSMAQQGWLAVATPESLGGLGLGLVDATVLLVESAAHLACVPLASQLHALTALARTPIGPRLLSGERVAATAHGDGPVLYGASAEILVIRSDDELRVVDLDGIDRSAEPVMDQTRELAWLDLETVPSEPVDSPVTASTFEDIGALFSAAQLLGGAQAAMDLAVGYASQRHQFDRPIGSFQAVKHRCADMLVDVEAMRSAVMYAAWALDVDDPDAGSAASVAKTWCGDAGIRVVQSALQIHGGIGFTWESPIHRYLKRAQLDQVSWGTPTDHRRRLAAHLRRRVATGQPLL